MDYKIDYIDGVVKGYSKNTKTHIQGSGGGGYMFDGFGYTDPVKISSSHSTSTHFFLEYNGGEMEINLNTEVNLRDNQNIRIFALTNTKKGLWNWVSLINFNTQNTSPLVSKNDLINLKVLRKKILFNSFPLNIIKILYFVFLAISTYLAISMVTSFSNLNTPQIRDIAENDFNTSVFRYGGFILLGISLIPLILILVYNSKINASNRKKTELIFGKIKTINQIS